MNEFKYYPKGEKQARHMDYDRAFRFVQDEYDSPFTQLKKLQEHKIPKLKLTHGHLKLHHIRANKNAHK